MIMITYISTSKQPFTEEDLMTLRMECEQRNAQMGITGVLIYSKGHFLQILEGKPDKVYTVYDHVNKDPRHALIFVDEQSTDERVFGKWHMGYLNLDEIRQSGLLDEEQVSMAALQHLLHEPTEVRRLLEIFEQVTC